MTPAEYADNFNSRQDLLRSPTESAPAPASQLDQIGEPTVQVYFKPDTSWGNVNALAGTLPDAEPNVLTYQSSARCSGDYAY